MGTITVIVISVIFYSAFKKALIERTGAQLSSINILKKTQIEEYFLFRKSNLTLLAQDPVIRNAYNKKKNEGTSDRAKVSLENLNRLFKNHNYKSWFLFNLNNDILFSNPSESQIQSILLNHDSLAEISSFLKSAQNGFILRDITDLIKKTEATVLMGIPIQGETGFLGFMVVEKNFKEIEDILFERTGLGETGESYLVARDFHMRSISRFFPEKNPYDILVETKASKRVFDEPEEKKVNVLDDYRGIPVLSYYRTIDVEGLHWAILTEIDYLEALKPIHSIRNKILITGLFLVSLIILVTVLLSKKISKPIVHLKEIILLLSRGKLPKGVEAESMDEIGEMTVAIDKLIEGLKRTSEFAHDIGGGNFKTSFTPLSDEDILGASLLQMRDRLKEHQKKEQALRRERSSALLEGQEKERKRISREIHDGIGQLLTVIRFKLSALDGHEDFKKETKAILDDTIAEVRRISNNVMPSVLLDFGLDAGIGNLSANTSKYTGIKVQYNFHKKTESPLNFETSVSLYRIAQEAVNNIVKYANAKTIHLSVFHEDEKIRMEIGDDGKGFDVHHYMNEGKLSNGIRNMEERINLLQGKFNIDSKIGIGTIIQIEIPLIMNML